MGLSIIPKGPSTQCSGTWDLGNKNSSTGFERIYDCFLLGPLGNYSWGSIGQDFVCRMLHFEFAVSFSSPGPLELPCMHAKDLVN